MHAGDKMNAPMAKIQTSTHAAQPEAILPSQHNVKHEMIEMRVYRGALKNPTVSTTYCVSLSKSFSLTEESRYGRVR